MYLVEFPGLGGLSLKISPIALEIGRWPIYWYGIIIAAGFMLAVFLTLRNSESFGIDPENIIDMILIATPIAIISARLYYVVFKWEDFRYNPSEVYKIWHGGIAIYGGLLGALIAAYLYARKKNINVLKLFDLAMPYFVLAQAIGRWGNFVNQEAYGGNTTLPWGMTSDKIRDELMLGRLTGVDVDPAVPVHPTFLYESLWNIGVFLFLIWYRKRTKREGEIFFLYMIMYGIGRFWVESLRTDSLMLGGFRVSQLLAFVLASAFAIVFLAGRKKMLGATFGSKGIYIGTNEAVKKLDEEKNKDIDETHT